MTRPLVHTIHASGSPTGIHYYQRFDPCPFRGHKLTETEGTVAPDEKLLTGTIYHAYQEVVGKFGQKVDYRTVRLLDDNEQLLIPDSDVGRKSLANAQKLFAAYRSSFPHDIMGDPVSVEETLKLEAQNGSGPTPLTMRLDRVAKFSRRQCDLVLKLRGVVIEPGYYVVDYKTTGSYATQETLCSTATRYALSLPSVLYPWGWNKLNPKAPVKGIIYDIGFWKPKRPVFALAVVPYGGGPRLVRALDALGRLYELSKETDARPGSGCVSWGKPCWFRDQCGWDTPMEVSSLEGGCV